MDTPKNCRECKCNKSCHAPYYGGSRCQYEKAITKAIISGKPKHENKHRPYHGVVLFLNLK